MAEKKPWEEDYGNTAVAEKLPWEEDYSKPQGATETPGLMDRISTNFKNIGAAAEDNVKTPTELEKGLSVAGRTIGAVGSIPVEASKSVYGAVSDFAKTHPTITNYAKAGLKSITGPLIPAAEAAAPIVKKGLETAGEKINEFSEAHPRAATLAETGLNLASMIPAGKIATLAKDASFDVLKGAAKDAGKGMQSTAKLAQGKSWKLTGNPEEVVAKRNIAAENDIWGKARDAGEKNNEVITKKYNELKTSLQEVSGLPSTRVNPGDLFDQAEAAALKNSDPVKEESIVAAFQKIKARVARDYAKIDPKTATPEEIDAALKNTQLDLADAQMLKQQIGEWGDDVFDVTKKGKKITAQSGDHQAYMNAYDQFKTAIEDVGPPGVKEKNQELSKLLGLRRDLRNRVAVQERNNFIPLDEVISATGAALSLGHGNPLPAALYGVQAASKSPSVAKGLYKLGGKLIPGEKTLPSFALEKELNVSLPDNAATPAYFRKGVNPESDNAAAIEKTAAQKAKEEADRRATMQAILKLRPKVTDEQEKIDAMRRFQRGVKPYQ